jgi:cytochrome c-type biogenesis protein CcmF
MIEKADTLLTRSESLTDRQASVALAQILAGLVNRYADDPPPANFRLITSPLVGWVWLGSILVFAGGLVAVWPAADAARRRATAGYAARVARDLGRA